MSMPPRRQLLVGMVITRQHSNSSCSVLPARMSLMLLHRGGRGANLLDALLCDQKAVSGRARYDLQLEHEWGLFLLPCPLACGAQAASSRQLPCALCVVLTLSLLLLYGLGPIKQAESTCAEEWQNDSEERCTSAWTSSNPHQGE